jgi:predicted O-methyltransferase YrrM
MPVLSCTARGRSVTEPKYPPLSADQRSRLIELLGQEVWAHCEMLEQLDQSWSRSGEPGEPGRGRIAEDEPIRGWSVSREQGLLLYSLVRALRPARLLELGGSFGYSTCWQCAAAAAYGGHLTTVEDDPTKIRVLRKLSPLFGETLTVVEHDLEDFIARAPGIFQFAFVDADPFAYPRLPEPLGRLMASGSMVAIDNAHNPKELVQLTRKLFDSLDFAYGWTLPAGHGMHIGVIRDSAKSDEIS